MQTQAVPQQPSDAYLRLVSSGDVLMDQAQVQAVALLDKLHNNLRRHDPSSVHEHDEHVIHRYRKQRQEQIKQAIAKHEEQQRELFGFTNDPKKLEQMAEVQVCPRSPSVWPAHLSACGVFSFTLAPTRKNTHLPHPPIDLSTLIWTRIC